MNIDIEVTENVTNVEIEFATPSAHAEKLPAIETILASVDTVAVCYGNVADNDDPDWIEKCADTSWYNEQLNTTTRGKTRKFPAEYLVVAESGTVTIYDLTDVDVPMWMVFNSGTSNMLQGDNSRSISSVSILNGVLVAGSSGYRLSVISFMEETGKSLGTVARRYQGNIAERNDGNGVVIDASLTPIVGGTVNDLAITLLPNAPINPATNMRYPTIAVATDGGVSIIDKVVGTVLDLGTGTKYVSTAFEEERVFAIEDAGTVDVWDEVPVSDTVAPDATYSSSSIPALNGLVVSIC